jgi:uncharacterized protein (DUF2384 family)
MKQNKLEVKLSRISKSLKGIKEKFNLSWSELHSMTHVSKTSLKRWIKEPPKNPNTLTLNSLNAFVVMDKLLMNIYSSQKEQVVWLDSPHPYFDNKTPRSLLSESPANVIYLRDYLATESRILMS